MALIARQSPLSGNQLILRKEIAVLRFIWPQPYFPLWLILFCVCSGAKASEPVKCNAENAIDIVISTFDTVQMLDKSSDLRVKSSSSIVETSYEKHKPINGLDVSRFCKASLLLNNGETIETRYRLMRNSSGSVDQIDEINSCFSKYIDDPPKDCETFLRNL